MTPNTTKRTLCVSFLSLILALIVMVFMTNSASAQATVSLQGMTAAPSGEGLQTEIKLVGGNANFVPNHLTCKVGQFLTFSNDTKVQQIITYMGIPSITLPAKGDVTVQCNMKGKVVLGLKSNPKARLIIITP